MRVHINRHIYLCIIVFIGAFILTNIICCIYMKTVPKKISRDYFDEEDFEEKSTYSVLGKIESTQDQEEKDNIKAIKKNIDMINKKQLIFNQNRFGPARAGNFIVVIQVHTNTAFLNLLISTLRKALGISGALLIFCHDYYDSDVNSIISEIKFAKYMQIFYPFSNQVFTGKFPGNDVEFCGGDFNCTKFCTEPSECIRNHDLAQQKHFWWWHMNFVFKRLRIMKDYHEPIVFLEENQYVLEDFLYVLKVLIDLMSKSRQYDMISFGSHAPAEITQFLVHEQQLSIEPWDPAHPSIAFAFNQTLWNNIRENRKLFCRFGDYRWEASLGFLSSKRPEGPFKMLSTVGPRVLPISMCDGTVAGCSLMNSIEDLQIFASRIRRGMYPHSFSFISSNKTVDDVAAGGDWKDVRDTELCIYLGSE